MFFVFYVFYLRKDFIGAISDQLYPSNFNIPIDTHYISTEKRTAIASDVWLLIRSDSHLGSQFSLWVLNRLYDHLLPSHLVGKRSEKIEQIDGTLKFIHQ